MRFMLLESLHINPFAGAARSYCPTAQELPFAGTPLSSWLIRKIRRGEVLTLLESAKRCRLHHIR